MAGSKSSFQGICPCSLCNKHQLATAPGIVMASGMSDLITEILFLRRIPALAFLQDLPDPFRTLIFVLPSTESMAKQSPPTPVI